MRLCIFAGKIYQRRFKTMEIKTTMKKYRRKLIWEGILKSFIFGLLVGFGANIIVAVLSCFLTFNGLWISIALLFGVAIAATPVFYFLKFRPTEKQVAERADMLGLEERVITMYELRGDTSYLATLQRNDATQKVTSSSAKFKINVFNTAFFTPLLIVLLVVAIVLSVSATTMSGLVAYGAFDEPVPGEVLPDSCTISYDVVIDIVTTEDEDGNVTSDDGIHGYIYDFATYGAVTGNKGDSSLSSIAVTQELTEGETTTMVVAVANPGYVFVSWDDGYELPYRMDVATGDAVYRAVFEAEDTDADTATGDSPEDYPVVLPNNGGTGDPIDQTQNTNSDPNSPPDEDEEGNEDDRNPNKGGEDNNSENVIDGQTAINTVIDDYISSASSNMSSDKTTSDSKKKGAGNYLSTLK